MPDDSHTPNGGALSTRFSSDLLLETRDIAGTAIETINARRLHSFLQVGKDFSTWMKDRIGQYDFIENVDFAILPNSGEKSGRGQPAKEYAISLDMAKELSMVERNARGKEARRYFIDCEKRAKATATIRRATTPRIDVAREHRLTHAMHLKIAKMCGLNGNQAVFSANRATAALTGVDTLNLMGITHVDAPQNEALLTPTEIGSRGNYGSARAVNLLLCSVGLQTCHVDPKGHKYYEPTEAGIQAGGVMQDTGKRHSSGAPVRQLRWASSVLAYLEQADHSEPQAA
jgi:phage anti-repressor protein